MRVRRHADNLCPNVQTAKHFPATAAVVEQQSPNLLASASNSLTTQVLADDQRMFLVVPATQDELPLRLRKRSSHLGPSTRTIGHLRKFAGRNSRAGNGRSQVYNGRRWTPQAQRGVP